MNKSPAPGVLTVMRHAFAVLALLVVTAGSAAATPAILRGGANHHLGDDSFVAQYGRAPTADDSEALRMRVHLTYVRTLLASRDATRPELATRRLQLLGYLDDYIAKGTTPRNTYVPQRNPVFIDRDGTICAVGYLIERSAGRDTAEQIAATHRLDYLEDIAGAMPSVAAWVEGSGFTLDELASIQPGYPGPEVMHMGGWLADQKADANADDEDGWQDPVGAPRPADGPYLVAAAGAKTAGAFAGRQMVGAWTVTVESKVRGHGTFVRGRGRWTSLRADGTKLAEGRFSKSRAHGTWTFFHPSGRIAAVGPMRDGRRDGAWTFFYDAASSPKLSVGSFAHGEPRGRWKHYGEHGDLVATTRGRAWTGLSIDIEPGATGVRHAVHQGIPADSFRLDGFFRGSDRLYINEQGKVYDGTAHALEQTESGSWVRRTCKWPKKTRTAAQTGDVTALHTMLRKTGDDGCDGKALAVGKKRVKRIEALLASRAQSHAPIPAFDIDPRPVTASDPDASDDDNNDSDTEDADDRGPGPRDNPDDLATYLTNSMTWYIEWPHVDQSFVAVYATLPGYHAPPPPEE